MFDNVDLILKRRDHIRSLQNGILEFQNRLELEKAELAQLQVKDEVADATNDVSRILI